jgi:hypothetical protein
MWSGIQLHHYCLVTRDTGWLNGKWMLNNKNEKINYYLKQLWLTKILFNMPSLVGSGERWIEIMCSLIHSACRTIILCQVWVVVLFQDMSSFLQYILGNRDWSLMMQLEVQSCNANISFWFPVHIFYHFIPPDSNCFAPEHWREMEQSNKVTRDSDLKLWGILIHAYGLGLFTSSTQITHRAVGSSSKLAGLGPCDTHQTVVSPLDFGLYS